MRYNINKFNAFLVVLSTVCAITSYNSYKSGDIANAIYSLQWSILFILGINIDRILVPIPKKPKNKQNKT